MLTPRRPDRQPCHRPSGIAVSHGGLNNILSLASLLLIWARRTDTDIWQKVTDLHTSEERRHAHVMRMALPLDPCPAHAFARATLSDLALQLRVRLRRRLARGNNPCPGEQQRRAGAMDPLFDAINQCHRRLWHILQDANYAFVPLARPAPDLPLDINPWKEQ